jgi:chromosome segregation ATPase
LDTRLTGSINRFEAELNRFECSALLASLKDYNRQVKDAPVDLPKFDPALPEARQLLENYKVESVDLLWRICNEVEPLKKQVGATKKSTGELTTEINSLRRAREEARAQVQILVQNFAPSEEIQKWVGVLERRAPEIEELASKLRVRNNDLADTEAEMNKLSSAAPFRLSRATGRGMLTRAQQTLNETFNLKREDFLAQPDEWKLRVEMLSATLLKTTAHLEAELMAAPARAKGGSNVPLALRIELESHLKPTDRFKAQISEDVWAALPEEARAKFTSLVEDLQRLERAKRTVQPRTGPPFEVATVVEGLDSSDIQDRWNQLFGYLGARQAVVDTIRQQTRDPNRFMQGD